MDEVILTYHESRDDIFWGHLTGAGVGIVGAFLGPALVWFFQGPFIVVIGVFLLFAANGAMFSWMAWETSRQPHGFTCTLTRERIRCTCPVQGTGDSFDISLLELKEVCEIQGESRRF